MKKTLLILSFLSCQSLVALTQIPPIPDSLTSAEYETIEKIKSAPEKVFSTPILRKISADSMSALKAQKEFAYMKYIDSFFRNQQAPEKKIVKKEAEAKPGLFSNPGLRTLYWLLAFAAVIWIVWHLFIGKGSLFTSNKKRQHLPDEPSNETQAITPIENLITHAIRLKDYRLAIRYLYLHTLSLLGEKDLISLAPQKTNFHYIQELQGKTQHSVFLTLTLQYEYAWYGNFSLSSEQFEKIHQGFQQFFKDLQ